MIKTYNLTPEIYYSHSRDFQLIGRLYEIVFNHIKTNEETIYNLPFSQSSDDSLLELLSFTLGFKSKHNYPLNQLRALCSSFSSILKVKGTKKSLELTLDVLLRSEGIKEKATIIKDPVKPKLDIYIPADLKDTNLFNDMLEYILPAGLSYSISQHSFVSTVKTTETDSEDKYRPYAQKSITTSRVLTYDDEDDPTTIVDNGNIKNGRIDSTILIPYADDNNSVGG